MDLLDLLGGRNEVKDSENDTAPIELMSEFLVLISEGSMKEALHLCDKILLYEPSNKMIKDYQLSLTTYIQQGLDDTDSDDNEDDGEDEEEGVEDGASDADSVDTNDDEGGVAEEKDVKYSFAKANDEKKEHKK